MASTPISVAFTITSPEIQVLADFVPGVELRMVDHYRDVAGTEHGIFWVLADDFDRFEAALGDSRLIRTWTSLVGMPDQHLYDIVLVESGDLPTVVDISREHSIVWRTLTAQAGKLFVQAIAPDREALNTFRSAVRSEGYEFHLERATSDIDPMQDFAPTTLSPAQREAIVLAYERGYFREPREVSLADLGTELGISTSAVSGRLTRGLAALIEDCLGEEWAGGPDTSR